MVNESEEKIFDKVEKKIESKVVVVDYNPEEELNFFIDTSNGNQSSNSPHKHGWKQIDEKTGKPYCLVEELKDSLGTLIGWKLSFEDGTGSKADWDYDDLIIYIEYVFESDSFYSYDVEEEEVKKPKSKMKCSKKSKKKCSKKSKKDKTNRKANKKYQEIEMF